MKRIVSISLLIVLFCGISVMLVSAGPQLPIAVDDDYDYLWCEIGCPFIGGPPNVMSNDYDPNGRPLTVELVSDPSHGTVSLEDDGSFTYDPEWFYLGEDSFTYCACNGQQYSKEACVTISIQPNFEAPRAVPDGYTVLPDSILYIPVSGVLANDGGVSYLPEQLCADLIEDPKHGNLCLNLDGSFTYAPFSGFTGTDEFLYVASPAWDVYAFSCYTPVTITVSDSNHCVPEFPGEVLILPGIILGIFAIAVRIQKRR